MTLKTNTAEGGTDGTAVTTANSGGTSGNAFTAVAASSAGAITFSSAGAFSGSLGYRFLELTSATTCTADISDTTSSAFTVRVYIKLNGYPSANYQGPLHVRTASAAIGRINISTTGQLSITQGTLNNTSGFSTEVLALGTWYRLEFYGTGVGTAATDMELDVYVGSATGTPFMHREVLGQTTSAPVALVRYGRNNSAGSNDFYLDNIAQNIGASVPLGPTANGDAGDDQVVEPGQSLVTLTGTGTGTWAQVSGPTVTLTPTGTNATFTAPVVATNTNLVFSYGGDTCTVTVLRAIEFIVSGGVWVPVVPRAVV